MSCNAVAADETEMSAARRPTRHVIAPLSLEDLFLAARANLIVASFMKLCQNIVDCCCFLAGMVSHADRIAVASPAFTASAALTALAKLQSEASLAEKSTTYIATLRVPMMAVQTLLYRHSILLLFLPPGLTEATVEKVRERPEIQFLLAPHRRVLIFMLEGSMKERCHTVAGAIIADSGASFSYPTRPFFEFILVAQDTFEVRERHGAGVM
jgi:hypothetical protein